MGTVSSRVRRARSRRAVFGLVRPGAAARFLALFLAGAALLGLRFDDREAPRLFAVDLLAGGRAAARLRAEERVVFGRRGFRFAMGVVLSNLDSVAISVVRSVAYRN
jgi:hypothetical protein